MDATRQSLRRLLTVVVSLLLAMGLTLTLSACSEDPILGPDEGEPDDSGGSYSSINRLSPPSSTADSTVPTEVSPPDGITALNPERF